MKNYKIMLNGQNFVIDLGKGLARHGFYTTHYASADSKAEAELIAIESVKKHDNIMHNIKNNENDPPILYAEEIVEIETIDGTEQELSWFQEEL